MLSRFLSRLGHQSDKEAAIENRIVRGDFMGCQFIIFPVKENYSEWWTEGIIEAEERKEEGKQWTLTEEFGLLI